MKLDNLPDWIAAIASVVAAIAATIGVWMTVHTANAARRGQASARLRYETKIRLKNVWDLDISWLPETLGEAHSLTAEILSPPSLEFGDRKPDPPYDPHTPTWRLSEPVELINKARRKVVQLRQGRGSSDGLGATLLIWAPPGSGDSAKVRLTIRADASRSVLAKKTIAISPIN